MLELVGVPAADGDDAAVHVQLSDDGHAPFQLRTEGQRGAAAQTQQADQDVLLRILVGEEGLPAAVGHVVPPHQLHLNTHSESTPSTSGSVLKMKHDQLPGKVGLCGGSPECPLLLF